VSDVKSKECCVGIGRVVKSIFSIPHSLIVGNDLGSAFAPIMELGTNDEGKIYVDVFMSRCLDEGNHSTEVFSIDKSFCFSDEEIYSLVVFGCRQDNWLFGFD